MGSSELNAKYKQMLIFRTALRNATGMRHFSIISSLLKVFILGPLFLLCNLAVGADSDPRQFLNDQRKVDLTGRLEYFDDLTGNMSFTEVQEQPQEKFRPLEKPNYGFGFKGIRWIRFTLNSEKFSQKEFILEQKYSHLQNWTVFWNEDGRVFQQNVSEDTPSAERPFLLHVYALKLPKTNNIETTYYARYEPRGHALNIALSAMPIAEFTEIMEMEALIRGLFFGSIIILILYNATILVVLRAKIYLYYVYYLTFFAASYLYIFGYAPLFIDLNERWEQFFASCSFLALHSCVIFGRAILSMKDELPWTTRYLRVLEVILLLCAIGSFLAPVGVHYPIANLLALASFIGLLWAGLKRAYDGYKPAQIYAAGWSAFIIANFANSLTFMGVLPLNLFTAYVLQFTSMFEVTLFSLAIAVRFKIAGEVATAAKNGFIAMVSHELKTPLQSVVSCIDLLSSSGSDQEKNSKIFDRLRIAAHDLETQIQDLTDHARLELGKLPVKSITFDIAKVVLEVCSQFKVLAEKKHLTFAVDSPVSPTLVQSDPVRIKQILNNLIDNAIKYTETGGITVRVSADMSENRLAIKVIDTGIGIAEQQRTNIFEPFTQVDSGVRRRYDGIGMGLTIVRDLVQLLGGSISVTSQIGIGSTFCAMVPCRVSEPVSYMTESGNEDEPNILIIDDNVDLLELLKEIASSLGYTVDAFSSGQSAIKAIGKKNYRAILLDVNMPEMSGLDVAARIRSIGVYRKTPIIWISATDPKVGKDKNEALFTHFLAKPIRAANLRDVLESITPKG